MRFFEQNVLVTGAAAGVGRHIAQAFAAEGADIAILDFQDAGETSQDVIDLCLSTFHLRESNVGTDTSKQFVPLTL
jgi:NAD(P)-dependent dehydrogenase (short-subunit alcohol dehydrogenase family)